MDSTKMVPVDKEELSRYYLKKHKIKELFDNLTAALVYQRPEQPKEFIAEYFEKLLSARSKRVDIPHLFTDSNIRTLFGIMDPAEKEYINYSQYQAGMENLGVTKYDRNPAGFDKDCIRMDVFVSEAKKGLLVSTATYTAPAI